MKHDGPDKFKRAHITSTPKRTGLDDGPPLPSPKALARSAAKIEARFPAPQMVPRTELDALLERVILDKRDPHGRDRNFVAYDCWRMFESLARQYKEESAMRDRYKRQSKAWMDKALELSTEARCPVCVNGQTIDGQICQECHGKDCSSVAYDTLRIRYKRAVEACKLALKLPRPWIDGGVTYAEWDEAFAAIEAAIK